MVKTVVAAAYSTRRAGPTASMEGHQHAASQHGMLAPCQCPHGCSHHAGGQWLKDQAGSRQVFFVFCLRGQWLKNQAEEEALTDTASDRISSHYPSMLQLRFPVAASAAISRCPELVGNSPVVGSPGVFGSLGVVCIALSHCFLSKLSILRRNCLCMLLCLRSSLSSLYCIFSTTPFLR